MTLNRMTTVGALAQAATPISDVIGVDATPELIRGPLAGAGRPYLARLGWAVGAEEPAPATWRTTADVITPAGEEERQCAPER